MALSDAVLGFYDLSALISVYLSFMLIGGMHLIEKRYSERLPFGMTLLLAPFLFFLITNFTVWAFSPWYEKSFEGLLYCYSLGIPFLRNMLIGDLVYTAFLFGAFSFKLGTLTRWISLKTRIFVNATRTS
jgi:hypothetical protein